MKKLTKQQFKKLSFVKKVFYIFDQYVISALLGATLLFLLGSLIHQEYFVKPPIMNVEMIDADVNVSTCGFDGFLAEKGYPTGEDGVEISTVFQFPKEKTDYPFNPATLLICSFAEGKTDLYFWDRPEIDGFMTRMALMDLREILPYEVLVKYQDDLVFTASILEGGYPCGICLTDNEWVRENNYYDECIVGVAKNAEDPALIGAFLEYIL